MTKIKLPLLITGVIQALMARRIGAFFNFANDRVSNNPAINLAIISVIVASVIYSLVPALRIHSVESRGGRAIGEVELADHLARHTCLHPGGRPRRVAAIEAFNESLERHGRMLDHASGAMGRGWPAGYLRGPDQHALF
jgi:hypothetical protein